MAGNGSSDIPITELLVRVRAGDSDAFAQVYSAIYEELRRLARARRRKQFSFGETMNTTALVHETYLKLCQVPHPSYKDREHFLAVAATAMRQILVDEARRRLRAKRGGGAEHQPLDNVVAEDSSVARDSTLVLTVHDALKSLGESNPRLEKVIEYRFFGGMTEAEAASVLDLTERTIRRDWVKARAWLRLHLEELLPVA
ncbi:MAG: RNA polymerase subunit sigma-70 [Acidobacteria bacterium]|nr:MAG: RNA polymerase subunit sigma-70 [Acidobacteriota bacterium]